MKSTICLVLRTADRATRQQKPRPDFILFCSKNDLLQSSLVFSFILQLQVATAVVHSNSCGVLTVAEVPFESDVYWFAKWERGRCVILNTFLPTQQMWAAFKNHVVRREICAPFLPRIDVMISRGNHVWWHRSKIAALHVLWLVRAAQLARIFRPSHARVLPFLIVSLSCYAALSPQFQCILKKYAHVLS